MLWAIIFLEDDLARPRRRQAADVQQAYCAQPRCLIINEIDTGCTRGGTLGTSNTTRSSGRRPRDSNKRIMI